MKRFASLFVVLVLLFSMLSLVSCQREVKESTEEPIEEPIQKPVGKPTLIEFYSDT